jgi:hypothetical protein
MRSDLESSEIRFPLVSTIGSLPFFDLLNTSFASFSVVPEGAVTRSVDITVVTGSSRFGWNWISLEVIIPINFDRKVPFSANLSVQVILYKLKFMSPYLTVRIL